MARDYKNTPKNRRKTGNSHGRISGVLTFAAGLITGVCVVIALYLVEAVPGFIDNHPDPAISPAPLPIPEPIGLDGKRTDKRQQEGTQPRTPAPKFDFYTILPEMEVSVPEWETDAPPPPSESTAKNEIEAEDETETRTTAAKDKPALTATEDDRYILQIGSFRRPDEAERVKANLALLGVNTEIQRVVIDGGDVWHRVRAGPYQNARTLNQARQRLIDNNVDFMLLKLKRDSG